LRENQCEIAYKSDNYYQDNIISSQFSFFSLPCWPIWYYVMRSDQNEIHQNTLVLSWVTVLTQLSTMPPLPNGCCLQLIATDNGKNTKEHHPWISISFIYNNMVLGSSDWICSRSIYCPVAWVVWKVDNAIHLINHYPEDSAVCFLITYPLDSDLPGG